jgi:hypothetical protein
MRKLLLVFLMMFLTAIAAQSALAQSQPHTPEKGTPERKAILDAVRKYRKAPQEVYTPNGFNVLKGWAYVSARDPSDPEVDTEAFEYILRRTGNSWKVADEISHVEGSDWARDVKRIRKKFPSLPVSIFPSGQ